MLNIGCHCTGCINLPYGNRRIAAEGRGDSGIILVGDSPWKTEIEAGHNFHGPAGQLLNRILERLGITRDSLIITNSIQCQPPHLGWTDQPARYPEAISALRQCEPYLRETLDKGKPKVIVALGNVAMRQAINLNIAADITQRHAYVHETLYDIPAIPTFHPSYLLQGKHKLEIAVMFAIRRAQEVANGSYRESHFNLLLDPPVEDGYNYLRRHLTANNGRINLLMVDIETPESAKLDEEELEEKGASYHIIRAGFSLDNESAISFPYKEPYINLLQEALDAADNVSEWADNHFDTKRLRAAGHTIRGRVISGMWAWHFYQSDLLKGLGFVAPFFYAGPPWKHLASGQPALYNALDQVIGRKATTGSMDKLAAEGRLDRYLRHCVDADRIYVKMGATGITLDTDHFGRFRDRLKLEYREKVEEIQPLVDDKVKPVKLLKKQPKVMDGWTELPIPENVIDGKTAKEMIEAAKGIVSEREFKAAKKKINELKNPYRWKKVLPFNPGSPEQVKKLIRSLGLKVPVDRDGETTGAKHLKRFSKYPIFHQILIAKQKKTIISNYDWKVNEHGRVTTNYGYHPSTLRKCIAKGTPVEIVRDLSVNPKPPNIEDIRVGDLAYTYTKDGKLTCKKVLSVTKTGTMKVVRIHWESGYGPATWSGHTDMTPDHLVLLTDGSWCEAQKLIPHVRRLKWRGFKKLGSCVMALHRSISTTHWGYSKLWITGEKDGKLDHRVIFEAINGRLYEHVHHIDGNKLNNLPDNLSGQTASNHTQQTTLTRWADKELPDRISEAGIGHRARLKAHLQATRYPEPVAWCRYKPNNHRIMAVEWLDVPVDVYDIEVEDTHNFIAGELCVHNSSRNYNLQVIPKRSDLADEFRRSIVAAPGYYLLTSDGSAIEAVLVGYDAGSDSYIRLAKAGLHGWMTSAYHGQPIRLDLPFNELTKLCKAAKKKWPTDYETLKRVGHLSNYLGTPYRIYEEYPEEFASPIIAGQLQNFYFSTQPGREVRQWQSKVMSEAHKNNYLDNHFNYRHYFYSVFKRDVKTKQWMIDHDGDAKRAVAFRPQSDASAIQTEVILRLGEEPEMLDYLRLIIHDEIVAEVPEDKLEWAATFLHTEMTRPIPELNGLSIGAETKYGKNLGVYNEETNPLGMREMVVVEV